MIEHKGEEEFLSGEIQFLGRILLQASSPPGGAPSGFVNLYCRFKSGIAELFYRNDQGAERDLSASGGGAVSSVFGRTGAVAAVATDYPFYTPSLIPGGRITLTSATPILSSDVTGATSIYYALYLHDRVPIYDGTNWVMTAFTELTNTTTDNTKNPAAVGANSNYDLFVWNDSGTLRLGRGPAWSSATARGTGAGTTELERVNGIWMNKNAITNGPGADRGTYVGTVRSNGSSAIDWIATPAAAAGGALCTLGVWNTYNRVLSSALCRSSDSSWTYASAIWQAFNNSATQRVNFILGLNEDEITGQVSTFISVDGVSSNARISVGLDATNAMGQLANVVYEASGSSAYLEQTPRWQGLAGIGFHFLAPLEYAAAGTITNYGNAGQVGVTQTGFYVAGRF